jgi:prevent-host-death family protein
MKNQWQLQEAKSHFSEVVNEALSHGPQQITRHGEGVVVILSTKEFKKLTRPKGDIVNFFSRSPLANVELDLSRSREKARRLEL